MKFELTDGLGLISIGLSEIGSYFSFKRPLTAIWSDHRGSVGKYACVLPYSKEYRTEVRNRIIETLNTDYTGNGEELYQLLKPLFRLFSNGGYSMGYYSSGHYFQYRTMRDNCSAIHHYEWDVVFSESMDRKYVDTQEYESLTYEDGRLKRYYSPALVEDSTTSFYDGQSKCLIATQPDTEINDKRVSHYEKLIRQGKRPVAIIFNCYFHQQVTNPDKSMTDCSLQSGDYVLDGHHKLLAYRNLKIHPPLIEITYYPASREAMPFNIEELIEVLYPWQIEHILQNWHEKHRYIASALNNPHSRIHEFLKKFT